MIKTAITQYPVLDIIKDRWSNRAFDSKSISQDDLNTLFEAASWAPSAMNEQPWEYIYAQKSNPDKFAAMLDCLVPANQIWAKNADVIIACIARQTYAANGSPNGVASYDLGAANYSLLLQAQSMDIYGHIMGGFVPDKAIETLGLSENQKPITFMVLGYLGEADTLEEPFKTRELTPRSRKSLDEFVKAF